MLSNNSHSEQPQPSVASLSSLIGTGSVHNPATIVSFQQNGTPYAIAPGLHPSGTPLFQQTPGSTFSAFRPPQTPNTPQSALTTANDTSKPKPQLQNIVCTVYLGCDLELKRIALTARNAEYNPKRFAAVIMRIRQPRTTALIFSSGKMVCTGAKSEEDARLAARKYARIIQKLGFKAQFRDFKIQNMVGSCDVKFHIRLEGLALAHDRFATYEPELFPGLIYRMGKPNVVLLVFVSGKIVITGAKVREEIYEAFDNIYPILKNFQTMEKVRGGPSSAGTLV